MHITTVCPFCQTSYQVQPSLRGQPIRCPNGGCRKVFTITAETVSTTGNNQRSGSVGDMETPPTDTHQPLMGKRRARWLIAVLIAVPLAIVGCGGVHKSEAERFAEAKNELEQGHYGKAAALLHDLMEKFPQSEHAPEYRFLHDWATVCGPAADPGDNLADAVEKLHRFIEDHKKDPLMEQKGGDAGQLLLRLSRAFAERNATSSDVKIDLETAQSIEQLCRTVEGLGPDALSKPEATQIESDLSDLRKVRAAVARWRERR